MFVNYNRLCVFSTVLHAFCSLESVPIKINPSQHGAIRFGFRIRKKIVDQKHWSIPFDNGNIKWNYQQLIWLRSYYNYRPCPPALVLLQPFSWYLPIGLMLNSPYQLWEFSSQCDVRAAHPYPTVISMYLLIKDYTYEFIIYVLIIGAVNII